MPTPAFGPPAPIVLVPGLSLFDKLFGPCRPAAHHFPGVRAYFAVRGVEVVLARVSPTAGVVTRATELAAYVRARFGPRPVHLIGHSLGGLDARYAVARLGLGTQVLSLTTVGTPHRGTPFADWGVARFARVVRPLFAALRIPAGAFYDLTTAACARFNEAVPDVPGVVYRAVAGVCGKPWLGPEWRLPAAIVGRAEGANDGVVSVASATWGDATDVWHADHLNLVNWPNRRMRKAGAWVDRAADYAALLPV